MDRELKEDYENLYTSDLKHLEKNLDKLIEAKHQHSSKRQREETE